MKELTGFNGKYLIYEDGRIYSLFSDSFLSPHIATSGYYSINLSLPDKQKKLFYIHRLLAKEFKPNPLNKKYINHKDGNKLNNNLDNIEWCTPGENNDHAISTGLRKPTWLGRTGAKHCRSLPIIQKSLQGVFIKEWESALQAERELKVSSQNISHVCTGKRNHAGGFIWEFKKKD